MQKSEESVMDNLFELASKFKPSATATKRIKPPPREISLWRDVIMENGQVRIEPNVGNAVDEQKIIELGKESNMTDNQIAQDTQGTQDKPYKPADDADGANIGEAQTERPVAACKPESKEFLPMATVPNFDSIPHSLKELNRWLCWQLIPGEPTTKEPNPKPKKTPMTPKSDKLVNASVTNPENWLTFDEALSFYKRGLCSGIGFCLTLNNPPNVCCIDVDDCVNADGTLTDKAKAVIERCQNSWTERSQSGTGIHVWFIDAEFPGERGRKGNKVEVYAFNRYIAMTGVKVETSAEELLTVNGACRTVIEEFIGGVDKSARKPEIKISAIKDSPLSDDDRRLVEFCRSAECKDKDLTLYQLFNGDLENYFKSKGKEVDDSVADFALTLKLFSYVRSETADEQIQRVATVFNQSELSKRSKWLEREDYRKQTLAAAFEKWREGKSNSGKPARYWLPDAPLDLIIPDDFDLSNGSINQTVCYSNKKSKRIIVTRTPIIPTKIFREPNLKTTEYEVAVRTEGRWHFSVFDGRTLADTRAILALADIGVLVENPAALKSYFNAVIARNSESKRLPVVKAYSKPGWHENIFIYPPKGADYICKRAGIDYDGLFDEAGDADAWLEKLDAVSDSTIGQFTIGVACLAPLIHKLGLPNLHTHVWGAPNSGKTPALKFALSIYGNPNEGKLLRSFDSSVKNRVAMAVGLNDFPQGLDELETLAGKRAEAELSNAAYNYTLGIDGQKNHRNGTVRKAEQFRGTRLSTGERPYLKSNDKQGAYKRVLEVGVDEPLMADAQASDIHIFLADNYGHFGRKWIAYITDNAAQIKTDFKNVIAEVQSSQKNFFNVRSEDYEPTHFRAACAVWVAYCHFRFCLIKAEAFETAACVTFVREFMKNYLAPKEEFDETERALVMLESYINQHMNNFETLYWGGDKKRQIRPAPTYQGTDGMIFTCRLNLTNYTIPRGSVGFNRNALTQIFEKDFGFASADKLLKDFKAKKLLVEDTKDTRPGVSFWKPGENRKVRMYVFKPEAFEGTLVGTNTAAYEADEADDDKDDDDNSEAEAEA